MFVWRSCQEAGILPPLLRIHLVRRLLEAEEQVSHCKICLLPEAVPSAQIDVEGVCAYCRQYQSADRHAQKWQRLEREADLEIALEACRGQKHCDCLVNLSGAKDSCHLFYKIRCEYGLNLLTFTMSVNVPDIAWKTFIEPSTPCKPAGTPG